MTITYLPHCFNIIAMLGIASRVTLEKGISSQETNAAVVRGYLKTNFSQPTLLRGI